jgi:hypothetical protein
MKTITLKKFISHFGEERKGQIITGTRLKTS